MKRMMILVVLAAAFAAPQFANATAMGIRRAPPDTFTHVPTMCALPKGGFCNTGPMVRIGERCFCDGPQGRRYGEVRQK
jgi:hypothetical protein